MATVESNRSATRPTDNGTPEIDVSHFIRTKKDLEVDKLFRATVKFEASDLHLKVGKPPMIRVRNELRPLNRGPIEAEEMVRLLVPMMDERATRIYDEDGGVYGRR
jgi:twitching motility protein PilT